MMLSSIEVMEAAQIERDVLNNYIKEGLLPRPLVNPAKGDLTNPRQIGYFPEEILARIERINQLKKEGFDLPEIAQQLELEGYPVKRMVPASSVTEVAKPHAVTVGEPTRSDLNVGGSARMEPQGKPVPVGPELLASARQDTGESDQEAIPSRPDVESLLASMEQGDALNRSMLKKQLPVLTDIAVLVSDLEESSRICTELSPEEYFELVHQLWTAMDPIVRKYSGIYGKHPTNGIVCYFLPQTNRNFILNALLCAQEMKAEMRKISKEWQLRKDWVNELYLNTGLDQGHEWLGVLSVSTKVEFIVLGNIVGRATSVSTCATGGGVWATKNLLTTLTAPDRSRVKFGIRRHGSQGRDMVMNGLYCRLSEMAGVTESMCGDRISEMATLPVTEILEITG